VLKELLIYPVPTSDELDRSLVTRQLQLHVAKLLETSGDSRVKELCRVLVKDWGEHGTLATREAKGTPKSGKPLRNFPREVAEALPCLTECLSTTRPSKVSSAIKAIVSAQGGCGRAHACVRRDDAWARAGVLLKPCSLCSRRAAGTGRDLAAGAV